MCIYIYIYERYSLSIKTLGIAFQEFSQPEESVCVCVCEASEEVGICM